MTISLGTVNRNLADDHEERVEKCRNKVFRKCTVSHEFALFELRRFLLSCDQFILLLRECPKFIQIFVSSRDFPLYIIKNSHLTLFIYNFIALAIMVNHGETE